MMISLSTICQVSIRCDTTDGKVDTTDGKVDTTDGNVDTTDGKVTNLALCPLNPRKSTVYNYTSPF